MKIGLSMLGIHREMGGNFQYAVNMLQSLTDVINGNSLVVFYDNPALMEEPNFKFLNVKYVYIDHSLDRLSVFRRLMRFMYGMGLNIAPCFTQGRYADLDKQKCDVIFHPYWSTGAFVARTPSIVAVHDCAPKEVPEIMSFWSRVKLSLLIRAIVHRANGILADSDHGRNLLIRHYKTSPEKVFVVPFRPPRYLVNESEDRTSDVMQKYNLEPGYFFLPGRWGSYKNTERVLAALKQVSLSGLEQHLVLVGLKSHEIPVAEREIADNGLSDRVHVLGFVPDEDMASLYKAAIALIFPTLLGPTSIPVYEAMALGCPVIVSNISGYPEQVGDAGVLVDPYDVEDIANAMMRVANDKPLRKSMREKGQSRMRDLMHIDHGKILMDIAYKIVNQKNLESEHNCLDRKIRI